jgi:hypothetical protein
MNRYQPFRFRPAFGVAAVALCAATMSLAVAVPAALSPAITDPTAQRVSRSARAAIEVTILPARIDVVGIREASVASTPAHEAARRSGLRS